MIGGRLCRQKKALCTKPCKYQHGRMGTEEGVSVGEVKQRGCAEARVQVVESSGDHTIVQLIRITSESLFLNETARSLSLVLLNQNLWNWNLGNFLKFCN